MAAHAVDDEVLDVEEEEKVEVSGLPFLLPLPPPILQNGYSQVGYIFVAYIGK